MTDVTRDLRWTLPDNTEVYGAQRQLQAEELPPGCYFVTVRGFSSLVLVYDPNAPWASPDSHGFGGFVGWIAVADIPPQHPTHLKRGHGVGTYHYFSAREFHERTGLGHDWPGKKAT